MVEAAPLVIDFLEHYWTVLALASASEVEWMRMRLDESSCSAGLEFRAAHWHWPSVVVVPVVDR
jgi:hypothetical protein